MVRRRVLFRRSRARRGVSLPSRQPRTTHEALRMVAKRQIPVRGSAELQMEYDRINREHFKGKLPQTTIILADLPKVKHRAFSVCSKGLSVIVINTAHSKTLEEQKADLRHEIIHVAGIRGHGTLFEIYAEMLNTPLAASPEGKPLYKEDYERLEFEMKRKKEEEELKRREQKYGARKGEGTLMVNGKPAARVVCWTDAKTGKAVVPTRNIVKYDQVPKTAPEVTLVLFDKLGHPKMDMMTIPRNKLEEYHLVP